ncbi:hypothetical protein ES702_03813 [subsurface metagenome]
MAVLMIFKTKNGKEGRCDARCYDAQGSECCCCCGGVNHGVGFKQAYKNTWNRFDEMVKGADNFKKIVRISKQLFLFGDKEEEINGENKKFINRRSKNEEKKRDSIPKERIPDPQLY